MEISEKQKVLDRKLDNLSHVIQNSMSHAGGESPKLDRILEVVTELKDGQKTLEHNQLTMESNQSEMQLTMNKFGARIGDLEIKEDRRATREKAIDDAKKEHKERIKLEIESKRETRRTLWHVVSIAVAVIGVTLVYIELRTNGTLTKWGF